jgi:cyclic pyranopterin phosphate synthase
MSKLTHLDETGAARMVDVSEKHVTAREATAEAVIVLSHEAFEATLSGEGKKGDVLAAARIAGIMAAKKTSELIPLCHPIPLSQASIDLETDKARHAIYDMVKAVDRGAVIESVRLLSKSGGKSGDYKAPK